MSRLYANAHSDPDPFLVPGFMDLGGTAETFGNGFAICCKLLNEMLGN